MRQYTLGGLRGCRRCCCAWRVFYPIFTCSASVGASFYADAKRGGRVLSTPKNPPPPVHTDKEARGRPNPMVRFSIDGDEYLLSCSMLQMSGSANGSSGRPLSGSADGNSVNRRRCGQLATGFFGLSDAFSAIRTRCIATPLARKGADECILAIARCEAEIQIAFRVAS